MAVAHDEAVVVRAAIGLILEIGLDFDRLDVIAFVGGLPILLDVLVDLLHLHLVEAHERFVQSRVVLVKVLDRALVSFDSNLRLLVLGINVCILLFLELLIDAIDLLPRPAHPLGHRAIAAQRDK